MTGQGTETGRNALAGLPAVQSRRLHRNRLYRRGERTFSSLGRRTSATLQDDTAWHYTYNQRSEITSAIRKNASNVTQNNMRYVFDNIGNRTSSYEDATSKTYDANSLNQYTGIDVAGGNSISPQYDDDGNMTVEEEHPHVVGGALLVVLARLLRARALRGLGLGGDQEGKDAAMFCVACMGRSIEAPLMGTSP